MRPCTRCTRLIIQSGIKKVYVLQDVSDDTANRWKEDNDIADIMMKEAGVEIIIKR
jgi:deoxycytidylate deaminase